MAERREDRPIGRRAVLGMVGLGALGVLWGAKVQSGLERTLRPLTLRDRTGLSDLLPTAGRFRIYSVVGFLPKQRREDWTLEVAGLVDTPLTLGYTDLLSLPQTSLVRDFQCVTGWRVGDVHWDGVTVATLLDRAGVKQEATHLRFESFDGAYTESLTLEQARRDDVIVAHRMLGKEIGPEHGGPVRLYVAPMYGYKSLKWLNRIVVTKRLEPGYWEERGYDIDAWVGRSNGRADPATS
jgi:DMSO/TMAO reductase YedYZ molybdopterin-dependent catalytic subunit